MRLRAGKWRVGRGSACVSRSAWDSLARRWEEHVVLILSLGGLEHSVSERRRGEEKKETED